MLLLLLQAFPVIGLIQHQFGGFVLKLKHILGRLMSLRWLWFRGWLSFWIGGRFVRARTVQVGLADELIVGQVFLFCCSSHIAVSLKRERQHVGLDARGNRGFVWVQIAVTVLLDRCVGYQFVLALLAFDRIKWTFQPISYFKQSCLFDGSFWYWIFVWIRSPLLRFIVLETVK